MANISLMFGKRQHSLVCVMLYAYWVIYVFISLPIFIYIYIKLFIGRYCQTAHWRLVTPSRKSDARQTPSAAPFYSRPLGAQAPSPAMGWRRPGEAQRLRRAVREIWILAFSERQRTNAGRRWMTPDDSSRSVCANRHVTPTHSLYIHTYIHIHKPPCV